MRTLLSQIVVAVLAFSVVSSNAGSTVEETTVRASENVTRRNDAGTEQAESRYPLPSPSLARTYSFRDPTTVDAPEPTPEPRAEPEARAGRPDVLVLRALGTYLASYYGPGFDGNRTACGQTYDQRGISVAHKALPCGTLVTFTYRGRTVIAPVQDRGPWIAGREWDLSRGLKDALGCPDLCVLGASW